MSLVQVWSRIWGKIENILYLIYQSFSWIQPPKMSIILFQNRFHSEFTHLVMYCVYLSNNHLEDHLQQKAWFLGNNNKKSTTKSSPESSIDLRGCVWGGRFFWNFFKVIYKVVFLRIRNDSSCLIYCLSRMKLSI